MSSTLFKACSNFLCGIIISKLSDATLKIFRTVEKQSKRYIKAGADSSFMNCAVTLFW